MMIPRPAALSVLMRSTLSSSSHGPQQHPFSVSAVGVDRMRLTPRDWPLALL